MSANDEPNLLGSVNAEFWGASRQGGKQKGLGKASVQVEREERIRAHSRPILVSPDLVAIPGLAAQMGRLQDFRKS